MLTYKRSQCLPVILDFLKCIAGLPATKEIILGIKKNITCKRFKCKDLLDI